MSTASLMLVVGTRYALVFDAQRKNATVKAKSTAERRTLMFMEETVRPP